MISEVIKEYLVSLGVQIDKPGFNQMKTTLDQTSGVVSSSTSGWTKDFVKAGTLISTALAGVSASIAGIMTAAAKQDLNMEKYARSMLVSKSAALEMKTAIDALGESVQDIQLTPELMNRYRALVADGRNMKVGGDYEATMKNFRDLVFEFTRLKQEASYALQWVGYYLMKHLSKPLADAKQSFRNFNDSLIKNMPVWTEKVARALIYVINIGKHFIDLLRSIGKAIYDVWDAFPRGIKIATAALAGFFMILRASPLGRMIALISSLLLLVDDYFGYMEGKQAALGAVWDKLNGYMDIAKQKLTEWGAMLAPVWDSFLGYLQLAKAGVIDLTGKFSDWMQEVGQYKETQNFIDSLKELSLSIRDLGSNFLEFTSAAFKEFAKSIQKHNLVQRFIEAITALCRELNTIIGVLSEVFKWLAKSEIVKDLIDEFGGLIGILIDLLPLILNFLIIGKVFKFIKVLRVAIKYLGGMFKNLGGVGKAILDLFKSINNGKGFTGFWKGMGDIIKALKGVVVDCLGSVGKLGLALLALASGDWSKAKNLAKEALGLGKAEANAKANWQGGGTDGLSDKEKDAEPYIQEAAKEYNLNPNLLRALIKQESGFNPNILSPVGAIGYSQLMPETAEGLGVNPWNPRENIMGGAHYLRQQLDTFDGNIEKALAAYNAGPGAVMKYGGIPPYEETQNYVSSILSNLQDYEQKTAYDKPGNEDQQSFRDSSDQPAFQNLSDGLRDPTWWDKLKEWRNKILFTAKSSSTDSLVRPSSYLANGFMSADPMLLNNFMQSSAPVYAQNSSGVTNVTYQINNEVNVTNTNASADDIGNAVGTKTVSSLNNRATYVLQNRALNGIQV